MDQDELLGQVVDVLEEMGVPYMVVGSFASGVLGEPRFTQDVDIVVSLIPEDVVVLCRAFSDPQYYIDAGTAREAMRTGGMFNLIHAASGNKVDFMIARTDEWGRHQMFNRQKIRVTEKITCYVASPADVIIAKLMYFKEGGSEKHLRDITGMLTAHKCSVDVDYVKHWATEFGVADTWNLILERVSDNTVRNEAITPPSAPPPPPESPT
ncbi:MAG: nucleotidyltransferase [Phycisphaeraceae bacterium]